MRLFLLLSVMGCSSLPEMYEDNRHEIMGFCDAVERDMKQVSKTGRAICYMEGFKIALRCNVPFPLSFFACK